MDCGLELPAVRLNADRLADEPVAAVDCLVSELRRDVDDVEARMRQGRHRRVVLLRRATSTLVDSQWLDIN
jgi:hypothetical protein